MEGIIAQLETHIKLFSEIDAAMVNAAAHIAAACFLNGGKLYTCGNGASAWLANYTASLFMNKCIMSRPPLPAIPLANNISYASFYDSGHLDKDIFEKQIVALATPADMVWGFVASDITGVSAETVIRTLRAAAQNNIKNIGYFGKNSTNMHGICDINFGINHKDAVRVTEIHLAIVHAICDAVDNIIFSSPSSVKADT